MCKDQDLLQFIRDTFLRDLVYAAVASIHGTYKPEIFVALGETHNELIFGKILLVISKIVKDDISSFVVRKTSSTFLHSFRIYQLSVRERGSISAVQQNDIRDTNAIAPYNVLGHQILKLRSSLVLAEGTGMYHRYSVKIGSYCWLCKPEGT